MIRPWRIVTLTRSTRTDGPLRGGGITHVLLQVNLHDQRTHDTRVQLVYEELRGENERGIRQVAPLHRCLELSGAMFPVRSLATHRLQVFLPGLL